MKRPRLVIALVLALVGGAAAAGIAARDAVYWDQPLPGVELRQVDLNRLVSVTVGHRSYNARPGVVLKVDGAATDRALVDAGRGSFFQRMGRVVHPSPEPIVVDPVLVPRPELGEVAARLSAELPRPRPAQIVNRRGEYRIVPARAGEAAEAAVAEAKALVAAPIALTFKSEDVGTLQPAQLARLVRLRGDRDRFRVGFHPERLAKAVEPMLDPWRARAVNARFVVDGARVRVAPSKPGLAVDAAWVADSVAGAAGSATPRASLRLKQVAADLTTREAERLGIRERISSFTTEMGPSSANRIHNVHLMADYIDGTIIRPGDTFSFNDRVGPRTVERGFLEGQMIVGSLLLPSIGGGVCQTATTLFNNAFDLGLPILDRRNHSFYISHYPLGRDAAVSWGGPDFAFRNDLKTAILIKARYTDDTLTFVFYGTDPDRRIVASAGPKRNWRSPRTTYALDPYAPRGSVRTVSGSNQPGFDVTVTRKVYERGKLLREDAVASSYVAVGPTQIYGPGRSIPGPYFVLPRV